MGSGLSMSVSCRDHRQVHQGVQAGVEEGRGRLPDELVALTGWSRDNARRRLTAAANAKPGKGRQVAKPAGRPRSPFRGQYTLVSSNS